MIDIVFFKDHLIKKRHWIDGATFASRIRALVCDQLRPYFRPADKILPLKFSFNAFFSETLTNDYK